MIVVKVGVPPKEVDNRIWAHWRVFLVDSIEWPKDSVIYTDLVLPNGHITSSSSAALFIYSTDQNKIRAEIEDELINHILAKDYLDYSFDKYPDLVELVSQHIVIEIHRRNQRKELLRKLDGLL